MLAFARLSACGKERRWRGKLFKASEGTSKLAGLLVAIVVRGRSPSFPRLLQTPSRFPGSSRTPAAKGRRKGGREGIRVGGVAEVGWGGGSEGVPLPPPLSPPFGTFSCID